MTEISIWTGMDFFRWQIVLCFGVVFLVIFSFAFAINGMTREASNGWAFWRIGR